MLPGLTEHACNSDAGVVRVDDRDSDSKSDLSENIIDMNDLSLEEEPEGAASDDSSVDTASLDSEGDNVTADSSTDQEGIVPAAYVPGNDPVLVHASQFGLNSIHDITTRILLFTGMYPTIPDFLVDPAQREAFMLGLHASNQELREERLGLAGELLVLHTQTLVEETKENVKLTSEGSEMVRFPRIMPDEERLARIQEAFDSMM